MHICAAPKSKNFESLWSFSDVGKIDKWYEENEMRRNHDEYKATGMETQFSSSKVQVFLYYVLIGNVTLLLLSGSRGRGRGVGLPYKKGGVALRKF